MDSNGKPLVTYVDMEEQYDKFKKLRREDVERLQEWQRQQPHLPDPYHPIECALYLHSCYYSNEAAKQRIDTFYTLRPHCAEFFVGWEPLGQELQLAMDTCLIVPLPDLTPEGYLVCYIRLMDTNAKNFNYDANVKLLGMIIDLTLTRRGCFKGHIIVVDQEGGTITHLLKCPLSSIRKSLLFLQAAVPVRLKSAHAVNAVPFMDKILALMRPFLSKQFYDMIHVHVGDNSTIFKFVPKEILPIECGGSKFNAIQYFQNVFRKDIEMHSEYLKLKELQVVDEFKRLSEPCNIEELFGVNGTFRKLEID